MVLHEIFSMFQIITFAIFNRIDMLTMHVTSSIFSPCGSSGKTCAMAVANRGTSSHIAGVVELRDGIKQSALTSEQRLDKGTT